MAKAVKTENVMCKEGYKLCGWSISCKNKYMVSYPSIPSTLEKPSSPGNAKKIKAARKELAIKLIVNARITFGSLIIKKFRANSK